LSLVVLLVVLLAFSVLNVCFVAAIIPPFPANAPRTFMSAEKEHMRQLRSGIAAQRIVRILS
jgi:hypothetical protein